LQPPPWKRCSTKPAAVFLARTGTSKTGIRSALATRSGYDRSRRLDDRIRAVMVLFAQRFVR